MEEVQVMPGVYLTTFANDRSNASKPTNETSNNLQTSLGIPVDASELESDNPEVIQLEIARLRLSAQKLLESNAILKEFLETDADPEYSQAIAENVDVIDRQLRSIKKHMQKLALLSNHSNGVESADVVGMGMGTRGPCLSEMLQINPQPLQNPQQPQTHPQEQIQQEEEQEEVGVYL
ncbi:hypothetical protein HDU77_009627 [Chytriomyces hyalinus]|nr:hypothetical protein HDU77_009627 [Chytriomyces hyalinus]